MTSIPLQSNQVVNNESGSSASLEQRNRRPIGSTNTSPARASEQQDLAATSDLSHKRTPPFDWQLLPQKELDRIAYNSHKQRKARLKVNPPTCSYCPEARFTSLAMLSTHQHSKKHQRRVHQHEQLHTANSDCTPTLMSKQSEKQGDRRERKWIPTASSVPTALSVSDDSAAFMDQDAVAEEHGGHGSSLASSTMADIQSTLTSTQDTVGKAGNNGSVNKISMSVGKSTASEERTQKSAKQRRRKTERDRKKARTQSQLVQNQLQTIPAALSPIDHVMEPVEGEPRGSQKEDPGTIEKEPYTPLTRQLSDYNSLSGTGVGMAVTCAPIYQQSTSNNTSSMSSVELSAASKGITIPSDNPPLRQYCSICKTNWRQRKAWQGHLLSAQHLRRTLKLMQQRATNIRPFRRMDVLSSMDQVGWGTAMGVVEEDDDEEEEEEEEEQEKQQEKKRRVDEFDDNNTQRPPKTVTIISTWEIGSAV